MAYYDDYYPEYRPVKTPLMAPASRVVKKRTPSSHNQRMLLILVAVLLLSLAFMKLSPGHVANASDSTAPPPASQAAGQPEVAAGEAAGPAAESGGGDSEIGSGRIMPGANGQLSSVFTKEVHHWTPQIIEWSTLYGVDPNMAAIIMQIESCGDPGAVSHAGAQGLFQVMPFHFAAGEDALDPDTNARRGLNYFVERLNQTGGDVGRAFAGYNGGHRAAASSWDSWPAETQRYYRWSTGIYEDINAGLAESPTLQSWLQAGGASLCQQAATRIGLQ